MVAAVVLEYPATMYQKRKRGDETMRYKTMVLTLAILAVLAASAYAQTTVIPRYTVIPVVIETGLNSAISQVGDTFITHCSQLNCGGFPQNTRFTGQVTSVTPRSGNAPGQIAVAFTQAILPTGGQINISGSLTSLDPNNVMVDPSGRLVGRVETRNDRNKFIGYGAGAGLLIGALTGDILKGTLIGAAAGYIFGSVRGSQTVAREADIPPSTEFGILLNQDVTLGTPLPPITPPGGGAGPVTPPAVQPIELAFAGQRPYTTPSGVVLVPFRSVMNAVDVPFRYNSRTRTVSLYTDEGFSLTHRAGSRIVGIDGSTRYISAPSRIIGGSLYIPTDFISIATDRTATWQPATQTLRIQ